MGSNLQRKFSWGENQAPFVHIPPAGYRGLSSFHKYWGKKPTEAWRFLIKNLTEKDDIILDPFLGSGLIAKECTDLKRRFIGFDINPISIELTKLYLELPSYSELKNAILRIEDSVKDSINDMYRLSNGSVATHFLWHGNSITKIWAKSGQKRVEQDVSKTEIEKLHSPPSYMLQNGRSIRLFDNSRINSKKSFSLEDLFTSRALRSIDLLKKEMNYFDGKTKRALLLILSSSLGQMSNMVFAIRKRSKATSNKANKIEVGSWIIGYWRPKQHFEINAWNCFENKARKILKAIEVEAHNSFITEDLEKLLSINEGAYICVGDSESRLKNIPSNSIKAVLTDPPHGDRIPYLELSEMWNAVIGLDSNYADELVVSNAKERGKNVSAYNNKLANIFSECSRVLKENGLLAVMFNARSTDHWDSLNKIEIATGLEYLGCYPMEYSARSVVQDNRKGALKKDYVLLYAKRIGRTQRNNLKDKFSLINGWSVEHPNKA